MREVTVYYSYDDKEFFDRDECLRYERQAVEAMMSVNDCYDFLIKISVVMSPLTIGAKMLRSGWIGYRMRRSIVSMLRCVTSCPKTLCGLLTANGDIVLPPKISMGKLVCSSMTTLRTSGLKWVSSPL